ncbi:hypothetical protein VM1G_04356 [Cytospora mali]|uniref:Uncharacterized protein n=1 Tax=Cytospora mali TaxID=578113 RepID=A0A194VYJ4_CYTMA|nr:hypothetical protein VM1G_04356 [Valsa mali]
MGAQSVSKKRGLMDRLRQVRSAALPASATSYEKYEKPPIYPPTHAEVDTLHRGRSGERPSAKSRPAHREGALDIGELDTKLERFARTSRHPRGTMQTMDDGSDCDPLERVARPESTSQAAAAAAAAKGAGSRSDLPGDGEEPGTSSDYETFIREAEEDDRRRGPSSKEHNTAPGRGREPPLNSFYSNNWMAQSEPQQKLSEIQESGDEDGSGGSSKSSGGEGTADMAKDAAPRMSLPRAHTESCVQARHVQFAGERAGGRRGSGASCTHRLKSPPRPVRRQRSMIKTTSGRLGTEGVSKTV